ncbi:MAG TPA: hypothetical protein VG929_09730 [Actinomycetota bacterium]|nr:hypothetical protein [Actinomycetota bacterium]
MLSATCVVFLLIAALSGCDTSTPTVEDVIVPYERRPVQQADPDQWPPLATEQEALQPTFESVPKSVHPGDDLRYVIALHNNGGDDVSLHPCPAYYSSWGESLPVAEANEFLNCPEAPSAVPGNGTVRFEMVIDLPDGLTGESGTIIWQLKGANDAETEPAFSRMITMRARP